MSSVTSTPVSPQQGNNISLFSRGWSFVRELGAREYRRVSTSSLNGVVGLLFIIAVGLTIFGIVMVLSASSVEMIALGTSPFSQVTRQLMFGVIGFVAMIVLMFIPVRIYRRRWVMHSLIIGAILLQILVLGIGVEVGGNRNWIRFAGIQIQPSEFGKLALILWAAWILKCQGDVSQGFRKLFFPLLFGAIPLAGLILLGHDVGTVLIYAIFLLAMMWIAGMNWKVTGTVGLIGIGAFLILVVTSQNRISRVLGMFGNCQGAACDQSGAGLAAIASGGFWGVGLGRSRQKYNYLPEAHNDYIFAVIGEELGLLGTLLIIILYFGLVYCAVRIMLRSADRFVTLATAGILAWILGQASVNIAMVTGLLPVIGVPLPFISYGGSSLIASLMAVGVLIGFARYTPLKAITSESGEFLTTVHASHKDTVRRAKLGAIVVRENQELAANNWQGGFDILDNQFTRAMNLKVSAFDVGVKQAKKTGHVSNQSAATERVAVDKLSKKQMPSAPQKASSKPSPDRDKYSESRQEQHHQSSGSLEQPSKSPGNNKNIRNVADPGQKGSNKTRQPSQPTQESNTRKLPPGLAPVKQIRARSNNKK